jgi:hypothetical protein
MKARDQQRAQKGAAASTESRDETKKPALSGRL